MANDIKITFSLDGQEYAISGIKRLEETLKILSSTTEKSTTAATQSYQKFVTELSKLSSAEESLKKLAGASDVVGKAISEAFGAAKSDIIGKMKDEVESLNKQLEASVQKTKNLASEIQQAKDRGAAQEEIHAKQEELRVTGIEHIQLAKRQEEATAMFQKATTTAPVQPEVPIYQRPIKPVSFEADGGIGQVLQMIASGNIGGLLRGAGGVGIGLAAAYGIADRTLNPNIPEIAQTELRQMRMQSMAEAQEGNVARALLRSSGTGMAERIARGEGSAWGVFKNELMRPIYGIKSFYKGTTGAEEEELGLRREYEDPQVANLMGMARGGRLALDLSRRYRTEERTLSMAGMSNTYQLLAQAGVDIDEADPLVRGMARFRGEDITGARAFLPYARFGFSGNFQTAIARSGRNISNEMSNMMDQFAGASLDGRNQSAIEMYSNYAAAQQQVYGYGSSAVDLGKPLMATFGATQPGMRDWANQQGISLNETAMMDLSAQSTAMLTQQAQDPGTLENRMYGQYLRSLGFSPSATALMLSRGIQTPEIQRMIVNRGGNTDALKRISGARSKMFGRMMGGDTGVQEFEKETGVSATGAILLGTAKNAAQTQNLAMAAEQGSIFAEPRRGEGTKISGPATTVVDEAAKGKSQELLVASKAVGQEIGKAVADAIRESYKQSTKEMLDTFKVPTAAPNKPYNGPKQ